jgi:hypothetical protein
MNEKEGEEMQKFRTISFLFIILLFFGASAHAYDGKAYYDVAISGNYAYVADIASGLKDLVET